MREVKLLGLTDRWIIDIQDSRVKELELSKKARILSTYRLVLGAHPPMTFLLVFPWKLIGATGNVSKYITPVVTFGVFIAVAQKKNSSLSVSSAFTSLSLLSLLTSPLSLMFTALPQTFMALACLTRIQDFLIENEKAPKTGVSGMFLFKKFVISRMFTHSWKLVLLTSYTDKLLNQNSIFEQRNHPLNQHCDMTLSWHLWALHKFSRMIIKK